MSTKDYVDNENPAIFRHLHSENLIPDYVMESPRITSEDTEGLSVVAFADPYTRSYPCHTKAACWQSAAWFAGNAGDEVHIRENIEKMAAAHGISEDVNAVFNHLYDGFAKAAEAELVEEPRYALSMNLGGYKGRGFEQYYPINSYHEVARSGEEAAEDYLGGALPMPVMRKVASAIMQAASQFAVPTCEMPKVVCQFGIQRLPDPFAAAVMVDMRKSAGIDMVPYVTMLTGLQDAMRKCASHNEAIVLADDVAEKMYHLDHDNGIRYNGRIEDPYSLIFSGPTVDELEKAAGQIVTIENVNIPVVDFLNLSDDKIDETFGKRVATVIKEAKAQVAGEPDMEKTASATNLLATLPTEVNKVLLATLADVGW